MKVLEYSEKETICGNCKHFKTHYVYYAGRYHAIHHGHCMHPRIKGRKVTDEACSRFEERGEGDAEAETK